jgi:hypothetical protein
MILTLSLAAGLLAAPEPQAGQQKGWVVELHGYTYHRQAKPKARWIIIDSQWPQPKAAPKVEPIESFYVDDLPAFFNRLKER